MTKDILHLMDVIDAGMPLDQQNVWKRRALAAIQSCANPHIVAPQFMLWLITDAGVPGMDGDTIATAQRRAAEAIQDGLPDDIAEAEIDRLALIYRRSTLFTALCGAEDHALDILRTAVSDDIHAAADCASLSADAFGDDMLRAEFCGRMADKLIELLAAAQVAT
jgi:hypothetical protein